MRETRITLPELALVAGTRGALGAGLALLLANRLSEEQRRAAGWALFLVGALSTIPLAFEVLGRRPVPTRSERAEWGAGERRPEPDGRFGRRDAPARA
jgi:hypothetical protein